MKKKIALLILLVLALAMILTACKKTVATQIVPRWDKDGENYEYVVGLADFATDENSKTHFQPYNHENDTYYKDFDVRTGEPINDLDQIRPTAVTGTFTLTISAQSDDYYQTVTTEQILYVTYKANEVTLNVDDLKDKGLFDSSNGESITLKSTTSTMVEFERSQKQTPRKSSTVVNGFYIGKSNQEISNYAISTEYDYSGKHTVAKIKVTSDGETKIDNSFTLKRYSAGSFIDSNQLFMYTRSFDKSADSFQDSPTVAVYDPLNQNMKVASFVWTAEAKAVLTNPKTNETIYTKLPTLGVVVGGLPFMLQESAPNLLDKLDEKEKPIDSTYFAIDPDAKHTPVRFRVGYLAFELKYDNYDTLWKALGGSAA